MATPARNLILENIATVLAAIDGTGSYKTTVATVERTVKPSDLVGAGLRPWLGFTPELSPMAHQPFGGLRVEMPIAIAGHVAAATDAARSDAVSNLVDDVIYALEIDTTRGGNAVMTTIESIDTNEGSPNTMDVKGGTGSFVVRAKVTYYRTTGAT